jgi:hypothetical protein
MAYAQTDLDDVQAAILALAGGERVVRVSVGEMVVEYSRSRLSDLKALRSEIRAELSAASGRKPFFFTSTSKGL